MVEQTIWPVEIVLEKTEEVGLEPTNRFLDGYSLANCWLTIRRTPPVQRNGISKTAYCKYLRTCFGL